MVKIDQGSRKLGNGRYQQQEGDAEDEARMFLKILRVCRSSRCVTVDCVTAEDLFLLITRSASVAHSSSLPRGHDSLDEIANDRRVQKVAHTTPENESAEERRGDPTAINLSVPYCLNKSRYTYEFMSKR